MDALPRRPILMRVHRISVPPEGRAPAVRATSRQTEASVGEPNSSSRSPLKRGDRLYSCPRIAYIEPSGVGKHYACVCGTCNGLNFQAVIVGRSLKVCAAVQWWSPNPIKGGTGAAAAYGQYVQLNFKDRDEKGHACRRDDRGQGDNNGPPKLAMTP